MKSWLMLVYVAVIAGLALGQATVPAWQETPENLWRLRSGLRQEGNSVEAREGEAIKYLERTDFDEQ